jgi:DnaJ-domain-containing protein 1
MSATEAPSNPLIPMVLRLLHANALREGPRGVSEYELLKALEAEGAGFPTTAVDDDLRLFQRHFLLMNALYRLQELLWRDERVWLTISPLRIAIEEAAAQGSAQMPGAVGSTALRDYYLDWRELEVTDGSAVASLLDSFWQRLHAHDGRAAALAALQLDADAGWDDVRRQYRRLAAATHPDRGGDGAQFLAVREAYEILRVAMRR